MPAKRPRGESPATRCSKRQHLSTHSESDSASDNSNIAGRSASRAPRQLLTEAALEALNRLCSSPAKANCLLKSESESEYATSMSTSVDVIYTRRKLLAYDIHVDTKARIPAELQAHIDMQITKARRAEDKVSPYAQRVVDMQLDAAMLREDSAVHELEPALMAGLHGQDASVPGVAGDFKCKLPRALLPVGDETARTAYGALAQPEADCSYGYAARFRTANPIFTLKQEKKLCAAGLEASLLQHCPFLTAQWKRPSGTEGIHHAQMQSARDGAVIVNLLHTLHGPNAAISDTCHFSCATDVETVQISVHWRADEMDDDNLPVAVHHMKFLDGGLMRKMADMREVRNLIKNIATYAFGPRLASIRAAIDAYTIPPQKRRTPTETDASLSAVPAEMPADAPAGLFPTPRTSVSSRPAKKKKP